MSQGNMRESKVQVQSLPEIPVQRQESNLKPSHLVLANVAINQEQLLSGQQVNHNQPGGTSVRFETIRDPHKSMVQLIDTMFYYLQFYADEANKKNEDAKLYLRSQKPVLEKQNHKSWLKTVPEQPAFVGKIYSCDWSLILKGTQELVTGYIIPSDRVISFNTEPEIYTPYLTINYIKKGNYLSWQIDKKTCTHEHIDELAQKLIERLLKCAKSQEWSHSVFHWEPKNSGVIPLQDDELDNTKYQAKFSGDPEELLVEMMKAAAEQRAFQSDEFKILPNEKTDPKTDSIEKSQYKTTVVNIENNKIENNSFEDTLKSLPEIVDQKLKQLIQEGGEAFSKHDLKSAQDILTLTDKLTELKTKIDELLVAFKTQH